MERPINGFVHIIESPSNLDLLDGRTEGRALSEALSLAEIPHRYNLVTNGQTLGQALGPRLVQAWKTFGGRPILHFSVHGNQDGISLTDRSFLSWHHLRQGLLPLNRAMQGGLLICMSSCFGSSGCRMAMYSDDEPPFWALVGNTGDAAWSDAAVAYITFYHLFFKGLPVETCVQSMKVASCDHNFMLHQGKSTKAGWITFLSQRPNQLSSAIEQAVGQTQDEVEREVSPPNPGLAADGLRPR